MRTHNIRAFVLAFLERLEAHAETGLIKVMGRLIRYLFSGGRLDPATDLGQGT
jgi:hypothetical protein